MDRTRVISCNGTESFLLDCIRRNVEESNRNESGSAQDRGLLAVIAGVKCDGQSNFDPSPFISLSVCVCACVCVCVCVCVHIIENITLRGDCNYCQPFQC